MDDDCSDLEALTAAAVAPLAYSPKDAATLVGLSAETIRRAIRAGELKAARIGGTTHRISAVELAQWWRNIGGGELFAAAPDSDDPA